MNPTVNEPWVIVVISLVVVVVLLAVVVLVTRTARRRKRSHAQGVAGEQEVVEDLTSHVTPVPVSSLTAEIGTVETEEFPQVTAVPELDETPSTDLADALVSDATAPAAEVAWGQMKPKQVRVLPPIVIHRIRSGGARVLRPKTLAAFSPEQVAALRPAAVGALKPAQLRRLSPDQVAALAPSQVAALSPRKRALLGL